MEICGKLFAWTLLLLDVEDFSGDRRKLTGGTRIRGFKNKTR